MFGIVSGADRGFPLKGPDSRLAAPPDRKAAHGCVARCFWYSDGERRAPILVVALLEEAS